MSKFASVLLDIVIHPSYDGLPPSVLHGLQQLADNAAAIVLSVSAIGVGVSLTVWMIGSWVDSHHAVSRAKQSLLVSASSGALLFVSVAAANYITRLFS